MLLAQAFLEETDVERRGLTLAPDALEALRNHHWPGNVLGAAGPPSFWAADEALPETSPELERGELVTALDSCAWNFRRTAHQLGVSRMTLYRWLRKYGISRSQPQSE